MSAYLLWGRGIRLYDTLDEAAEAAMWSMESDEDHVDRIEVVGTDGEPSRVIKDRELYALTDMFERRWREKMPAPPPHVANVFIDGEVLESFYGPDGVARAEALVEKWRPVLGDRIKLRRVQNYRYVT